MSDIWERKIRTFFRRFDLDKDGTLHRAEFVTLGEGIGDKEKFDPKQKEIVKKCFDDLFSHFVGGSGKHGDAVTEDSLVEFLKKQRDDPGFKKCLTDILASFFLPLDVNHDGYVDASEYSRLYDNAGVNSDFPKEAFDAMDVNHDGKLSFEEITNAFIHYMCSDDESSTAVFGLLL